MINIDLENETYICPFCGKGQAFRGSSSTNQIGYHIDWRGSIRGDVIYADRKIYCLKCTNKGCGKISITSFNGKKQFDIEPVFCCQTYPDYIPVQIRNDYTEGVSIIEKSPKAAATLFRRCIQGMIRDFWEVKVPSEKLYDEINSIKDKISGTQWNAIDGVRKIGNIGAHMKQDVNIIIDVEPNEAEKLQRLIELLIEKWYISRHDEKQLLNEISELSEKKVKERNETRN